MARIYKRSDRIAVKIDEITVKLAPLSLDQKSEIQQLMLTGRTKADLKLLTKGIALSIKYGLKSVEGIEDSDGNPYKLSLDSNDQLTDECVDELMNLELSKKLSLVCAGLVNGVPKDFTDENGNPIEGIEVVKPSKVEASKNG